MNQSPYSLFAASRLTAENPRRLFSRAILAAFLGFLALSPPTVGAATQEFFSSGGITITDNADASPYPSPINVSGVSGGAGRH